MTQNTAQANTVPWLALRVASGLSQREVERRLGWATAKGTGHGMLSLIERGVQPTPEQAAQLRALYGALLAGEVAS